MKGDTELDAKGLIREAFRIDGITPSQCRSIFLDWALSLPVDMDSTDALTRVLAQYGTGAPEHPMTDILRQGLTKMTNPRRRGGWRSRTRT